MLEFNQKLKRDNETFTVEEIFTTTVGTNTEITYTLRNLNTNQTVKVTNSYIHLYSKF